MSDSRTTLNGTVRAVTFGDPKTTPAPQSRREERRADRLADAAMQREDERLEREQLREDARLAAEERRRDAEAAQARKLAEKAAAEKAAAKAKRDKADARAARKVERVKARRAFVAAVSHHVPLPAVPVVVVSLIAACTGQAGAGYALGMGVMALAIPVLFEGAVLTFAGLTAHAIDRKQPHKFFYGATVGMGLLAATVNGAGHLIEDSSAAGVYRAGIYWVASSMALVVWAVVMRGKKAERSGAQAAEVARWRRLRRSHPVVARRARRIADLTGVDYPIAFEQAWERTHAVDIAQPLISEIRDTKRSTYRRAVALAWDGRKGRDKALGETNVPAVDTPMVETTETVPTEGVRDVPKLWMPGRRSVRRVHVATVPGTAPQAPKTQFPAENEANSDKTGDVADEAVLNLPDKVLKRAAKEWMSRLATVEKTPRLRSPKGHLGVSPYAFAQAMRMRRQDGPALVRALIDAQLIPAE
ncbi:hypothetical protein ACIBSV_15365 [Embleya sp. NPDC050154]|uniref:hypothetical protein n=1 Tax=Embleya sp. NPDC050154 TaxID=3363988 RepID=UPI0037BBBBB8